MEELFNNVLRSKGKNTVEEIIKWLKNANIIDAGTVQLATRMFSDQPNKKDIPFAKFKDVAMKFASAKNLDMETVVKQLAEVVATEAAENSIKSKIGGLLKCCRR